jgi:integrase
METARHSLLDNQVQLYRRPGSPHWHCSCSVGGKQRRSTTKEESLARAKDVARDWYLSLLGKYRAGGLRDGKTFREAAERFMDEYETLNRDQRSAIYIKDHRFRIKNHLNPFFGDMVLPEITAGKVQDYRIGRLKTGISRVDQFKKVKLAKQYAEAVRDAKAKGNRPPPPPATEEKYKPVSRSALHQEIVCLRQILKFANRHGWMEHLPDLSSPYQASSKISHRAWFSLDEYTTLYETTRKQAKDASGRRTRWANEQLHDLVLFMANTGVRPDEALRLEFRDVEVVEDDATDETILVIKVRGKRGVGYCKSLPGAVEPFRRLKERLRPTRVSELAEVDAAAKANATTRPVLTTPRPNDRVFPKSHNDLFRETLRKLDMLTDREGNPRTLYSLRHTYISLRLSEGADIYQIAKNCRTSVEMIEKYYASHIKDQLDTLAINVFRPKKKPKNPAPSAGGTGEAPTQPAP